MQASQSPEISQMDPQEYSQDAEIDTTDPSQETPAEDVFIPPSVERTSILAGRSYTYHSPVPGVISDNISTECVLGVDEAGRGPVLGPMVYSLFYLPFSSSEALLKAPDHRFSDSKALTADTRSALMSKLCCQSSALHRSCGWATRIMSARDISAGMLKPYGGSYNLNAQAMDATIDLIEGVFSRGLNVREIYVDTVGSPVTYQKKLERVFPTAKVTVAKKADSLFPCVSAASVCAKVTRDAALELLYESHLNPAAEANDADVDAKGWGSGYPSDARTSTWMKSNMDPVFGWGLECRFSWSTAKDLVEANTAPCKVDWPEDDPSANEMMKLTSFFGSSDGSQDAEAGLSNWFGSSVTEEDL